MFGKKKDSDKAASQAPFPLQVLTTEYLIEGTAQGNQQFYMPGGTEYWYPIELTDVKVTALGGDDVPVRTADKFEVKGDAVVALIPRRDVTTLQRYAEYEPYKIPLKGVFYFGPYLIEGTMMSVGHDRFNHALLIVDATIRHVSTKSNLGEISAPHVLVNTHWMHGREVK